MNKDVCQFYVVLGDSSFVAPNDSNVYINATNVSDYKIIQDEIFRIYKEKAKLGIGVAGEIIFLVGGISDSEKAKDIITKLRLNGKIEVIKREVPKKNIEENREIVNQHNIDNFEVNPLKEEVKEEVKIVQEESLNKVEENKQPDNVYKRDFESNNYSGYIGKPIKEKEKFSKLPLIIFIISLLLFVSSVVLLFVL